MFTNHIKKWSIIEQNSKTEMNEQGNKTKQHNTTHPD